MEAKAIIFLDIDGVLATGRVTRIFRGHQYCWIEPELCSVFNAITDSVEAGIIISSTWKTQHDYSTLVGYLREAGVTGNIIGTTPNTFSGIRGREIKLWLEEQKQDRHIVVIDDLYDVFPLEQWHIQPSEDIGLTQEEAQKAVEVLKLKPKWQYKTEKGLKDA